MKVAAIVLAAILFLVPLSMAFGFHSDDVFSTSHNIVGVINTIGEKGRNVITWVIDTFGDVRDGLENEYVLINNVRYHLQTRLFRLGEELYYVTYGFRNDIVLGIFQVETVFSDLILWDSNFPGAVSCSKNIITAEIILYDISGDVVARLKSRDNIGGYAGSFTSWAY